MSSPLSPHILALFDLVDEQPQPRLAARAQPRPSQTKATPCSCSANGKPTTEELLAALLHLRYALAGVLGVSVLLSILITYLVVRGW